MRNLTYFVKCLEKIIYVNIKQKNKLALHNLKHKKGMPRRDASFSFEAKIKLQFLDQGLVYMYTKMCMLVCLCVYLINNMDIPTNVSCYQRKYQLQGPKGDTQNMISLQIFEGMLLNCNQKSDLEV